MLESWSAGSEPDHSVFVCCSPKTRVSFVENRWREKRDSHLDMISEQNQGKDPDSAV